MLFQRGGARQFKLEVLNGGEEKVLISRQGPGFFGANTPAEVVTALRPYF
jgi:hypothetical protein